MLYLAFLASTLLSPLSPGEYPVGFRLLAEEDMTKLRLVVETARRVWG